MSIINRKGGAGGGGPDPGMMKQMQKLMMNSPMGKGGPKVEGAMVGRSIKRYRR